MRSETSTASNSRVPKGQLKIAQRFIAGEHSRQETKS
jgi:hypothetical protein